MRSNLLAFFADRLKVHLRDEGIRYDVIDAVFALGDDEVTAKGPAAEVALGEELADWEDTTTERLGAGEEVVAHKRAVTQDGVPRYLVKLPRSGDEEDKSGWISERLRGGARDAVCVVLRHVVRGRPLRYRVVRPGGAMVRATPSLDGAEVGLAPAWTALNVAERVRLPGGTTRLRVVAPSRWAGWASARPSTTTNGSPLPARRAA